MPKPPPRSSSGSDDAELVVDLGVQRRARGGRRPRSPEVSKIWEPMWECRPTSSSPGRASDRRRRPRAAAPLAIEKPNFWSSCAVAMYSWVCASTPGGHPDHAPAAARRARRRSAASRAISSKESTMIRPTPASTRPRQLGDATCCCRGSRSAPGGKPAAQRDGELAAACRRRGRGPPRRPSGRRSCRGRPCRRSRRRRPANASRNARGAGAEVVLVQHVRRGAVLGGQVGQRGRRRPQDAVGALRAVADHSAAPGR